MVPVLLFPEILTLQMKANAEYTARVLQDDGKRLLRTDTRDTRSASWQGASPLRPRAGKTACAVTCLPRGHGAH